MDSFLWCGGRGDYLSQSSSTVCAEFAAVCVCRSYHEGEDEKRKHAVQWTAYVLVIQRIALTNVKSEFYSEGNKRKNIDGLGRREELEKASGGNNRRKQRKSEPVGWCAAVHHAYICTHSFFFSFSLFSNFLNL